MSAARTRHWRRPLLTLSLLTLPLWSATFWHHLTRVLDTRNERAACLAFIHARPGWTTADDLATTLSELQDQADADFDRDLTVTQAQLTASTAPTGKLRLYALPVHAGQPWWMGKAQLPGRAFTISAPDYLRVPGLSVLALELPWRGGAFLPVTLTTPCGTYHQTVTLLLRTDQQGVVTIVTQDGATRIGEQHIPVRRT